MYKTTSLQTHKSWKSIGTLSSCWLIPCNYIKIIKLQGPWYLLTWFIKLCRILGYKRAKKCLRAPGFHWFPAFAIQKIKGMKSKNRNNNCFLMQGHPLFPLSLFWNDFTSCFHIKWHNDPFFHGLYKVRGYLAMIALERMKVSHASCCTILQFFVVIIRNRVPEIEWLLRTSLTRRER